MSDTPARDGQRSSMPLIEHLRELRKRLIISGIAVALGMVVAVFFANHVIEFLAAPVRPMLDGETLDRPMDLLYARLTAPLDLIPGWVWLTENQVHGAIVQIGSFEGIQAYLRIGIQTGFALALPVVAYQGWQFVAPGLYKTERRVVLPLTLASVFLFFLGASFAYLIILPIAFQFFLTILNVGEVTLSYNDAIQSASSIMLAFGLCYQLPVVIWFLAKIGLVDHHDLLRGFRYAVVVIFIVAALITPPDVITQIFLGIPLIGLYVISIIVAYFVSTKVRLEETAIADS